MLSLDKLFQQKRRLIFFFLLVALFFLLPIFKNLNNWGIWDWDIETFWYAVPRYTILKYYQFPLWNPYFCGGAPLFANPQSVLLSPFFLIILALGEVQGIKIIVLLHLVIGMLGVYSLARNYRLDKAAAILSSFIYMLSTMYSLPFITGATSFMFMAYIPWVFLYYLKSFVKFKYILVSTLFLVLMLFGGGIQLFVITLTFLAGYSFLEIILKKQSLIKTGKVFAIMLFFTFTLGAVKLIPAIEFISQNSRKLADYSGYSLNSLKYSLFNHDQSITAENKLPFRAFGFFDGISYGMNENGMYIGILPFLLFLLGFVVYFKHYLPLALSFIIFLWLSFGNRVPVRILRIWGAIRKFPLYNSMRVAQRFHFVFMLILVIFVGLGFQLISKFIQQKIKNKTLTEIIILFIVFFVYIDLLAVNYPILQTAFPISPIILPKSDNFYQIWRNPKYDKNSFSSFESSWFRSRSSMYPTMLANIGTICCYEAINVPRNAIPKDDAKYQGEVYLKDTGGNALFTYWSPNKMVVSVDTITNGYLVINQNYYPGWKIKSKSKKQIESVDKLLAVKVSPSDKVIEFSYLPNSFIIGLTLSLSTSLLLLIHLYKNPISKTKRCKSKSLKLIK